MKKRLLAFALTLAMALSLTVPAMAYNTKDFVDVPKGNWAYDAVMKMADAGVINGVGGGKFNPNGQVTAEQFITLVGRIVFPEVKASGSDWSGPYVTAAEEKGILDGTNITNDNLKDPISRYDMAMILKVAAREKGAEVKFADIGEISDGKSVPSKYVGAVRATYGTGLITGDENHNFNGQNSMRRSEAATVLDRLMRLEKGSGTRVDETEESGGRRFVFSYGHCAPRTDYDPSAAVREEDSERICFYTGYQSDGAKAEQDLTVYLHVGDTFQCAIEKVPEGYGYAEGDLNECVQSLLNQMDPDWNHLLIERIGKSIWSSTNENVVTVDENGLVTVIGTGSASIRVELPIHYYNEIWTTTMGSIAFVVDP